MKAEQERHIDEEPEAGPRSTVGTSSTHPAKEDLRLFMTGELSRPEARAVVRHLLRGCPACTHETRGLWRLGEKGAPVVARRPTRQPRQVGVWQ
jgi:hypothetical protein